MFKKRESIDILDIPELHRKKLIKLPDIQKEEATKITNDGFFDLSNTNADKKQEIVQTNTEIKPQENQITNFLSDFASIGSTQHQDAEIKENESVKDLKWRIENLEFKLEQLTEKMNSIEKSSQQ